VRPSLHQPAQALNTVRKLCDRAQRPPGKQIGRHNAHSSLTSLDNQPDPYSPSTMLRDDNNTITAFLQMGIKVILLRPSAQ
jgi:hypothetical protein